MKEEYRVIVAGDLNLPLNYGDRATRGINQQKVAVQKKIHCILEKWKVNRRKDGQIYISPYVEKRVKIKSGLYSGRQRSNGRTKIETKEKEMNWMKHQIPVRERA